MNGDIAGSNSIGTILIVLITLILAALVLLLFHIPSLEFNISPIPAIFIITSIENIDEITGIMNYDSRLILLHSGSLNYNNGNLKASLFKNGQPVNCNIETMNGHDFISTSHFGIQWMGGAGCSDTSWTPGEMTAIDFTDGTFQPGDSVQIDIIDNTTAQIISRHVYHAT
jgi:hypothetical protein